VPIQSRCSVVVAVVTGSRRDADQRLNILLSVVHLDAGASSVACHCSQVSDSAPRRVVSLGCVRRVRDCDDRARATINAFVHAMHTQLPTIALMTVVRTMYDVDVRAGAAFHTARFVTRDAVESPALDERARAAFGSYLR
jgi:hypothetical protein